MQQATVAILMGSDSDWPALEPATKVLESFRIGYSAHVISAHRSPARLVRFVEQAPGRGVKVFIAAAGGAAHLAGVVAAHTTQPVIGVPIESKQLKGLDSLLSTVQMPKGVPVATVGIGNADNAALLAVQMLALGDPAIARRLADYKRGLAEKTEKADAALQAQLPKRA
ncbi:MAG: 5-(carboxyamino)imidazole ribonucleotide mutase [Candidatus Omnitrophica bacterium]|nr:5-(carboxyamino)imidazole ribonucleotide mutase [Candidatus Omnitrophota bacterium]